jgi:coenzyme F420-dependent glucose-6-phosphate dehydrogenase
MRYLHLCAHEQFPPDELRSQAIAAEAAGFDGIGCSDHLQPWWEGGESGSAWPWLGAVAQATERVLFGTAVTPPGPRYHPALIAQAWATFELMFPGRPYLGFGSGEALNEFPVSGEWPSVGEQIERMDSALEVITRLWDGETVSGDYGWFKVDECKLYTRARSRPKLYVSAFGEQAAGVAARHADGVWTLGDPESAPGVVEAYHSAGGDGEVIIHSGFAWAQDDDRLMEGVRPWRATQPDEFYADDWLDPAKMQGHAA